MVVLYIGEIHEAVIKINKILPCVSEGNDRTSIIVGSIMSLMFIVKRSGTKISGMIGEIVLLVFQITAMCFCYLFFKVYEFVNSKVYIC